MGFATKECAWHQTSIKVLGRTIVGIQGFDFDKDFEKELLYAAGNEPIDIQEGNKKYGGNLELLKYEVDGLNAAAVLAGYEDITEVPGAAIVITCVFKAAVSDQARVITATGVAFTKLSVAMKQGAKSTQVTLPFLALKIVNK